MLDEGLNRRRFFFFFFSVCLFSSLFFVVFGCLVAGFGLLVLVC